MSDGIITDVYGNLQVAWDPTVFDSHNDATILSRMPRFGGRTTTTWSVGQHLLLCGALLGPLGIEEVPATVLAVTGHDAPEAYGFGDIPTPMKRLLRVRDPEVFGWTTIETWEALVLRRWLVAATEARHDFTELLAPGGIVERVDRAALQIEGAVLTRRPWGSFGGMPTAAVELAGARAIKSLLRQSDRAVAAELAATWLDAAGQVRRGA